MYVDQERKLIFIHNPKTAGRSLIQMLGFEEEANLKFVHISSQDAQRRIFQSTWSDYCSLAFVRDPIERIKSLYHYQKSIDYGRFLGFNDSHLWARRYTLNEWVALNLTKSIKSNWFGYPQSYWWEGTSVTYRFEDLQSAIQDLKGRGFVAQRQASIHLNASPRPPKKYEQIAPQLAAEIVKIDHLTISEFGYDNLVPV